MFKVTCTKCDYEGDINEFHDCHSEDGTVWFRCDSCKRTSQVGR